VVTAETWSPERNYLPTRAETWSPEWSYLPTSILHGLGRVFRVFELISIGILDICRFQGYLPALTASRRGHRADLYRPERMEALSEDDCSTSATAVSM
jgi:hypothetical protein